MGISAKLLQEGVLGLELLLLFMAALYLLPVVANAMPRRRRVRKRIRRVRSRLHIAARLVPAFGLVLVSGMPLVPAHGSPRRKEVRIGSPVGVDGVSPPHPSTRPERLVCTITGERGTRHPAIHRNAPVSQLFPRAGRGRIASIDHGARRRAMLVHPAGKRLGDDNVYEVRQGDNLWDIAERTLGTKDLRRVARYWPKIHRANRDVVGRDPSRIYPGQRLRLPPEA